MLPEPNPRPRRWVCFGRCRISIRVDGVIDRLHGGNTWKKSREKCEDVSETGHQATSTATAHEAQTKGRNCVQ